MKNKTYILNTILTAVIFAVLLVCVMIRTFAPNVILPELNIPNLVLISLVALVLDHYIAPGAHRCYICIPVLSAVSFGLLPFAAGFMTAGAALKAGIAGGVVFTVAAYLFTSAQDRISTGPAAKAAPVVTAIGIYLASQCFMGIFL